MIGITVRGDDFEGFAEEAFAELKPKMERGVIAATLHLHGAIKRKLSKRGTGRTYRRRKVLHTASAPGQPPALDTGRLRNSIAVTSPKWEGWSVSAEVGTNVEYARLLEYGGRTGRQNTTRIAARPYMRPTMEEETPAIEKVLRDAVR